MFYPCQPRGDNVVRGMWDAPLRSLRGQCGRVDFCENCAPETAVRHDFDEDYERIPVVDPDRAGRAGFARRMLGFLFEPGLVLLALGILGPILFVITGKLPFFLSPSSGPGFWVFYFLLIVGAVVYSAIMTSMTGQTWGKQLAGVIILQPDGHILNLNQAVARSCVAVLSAGVFGLGFLWALWDANGETWHDKFAGTTAFLWEEVS